MRSKTLASFLALACSVGTAGAAQIKIATLAPDGSFWMNEVRRGAEEIAERTDACRFRDCVHESEPGCAVKAAVDAILEQFPPE